MIFLSASIPSKERDEKFFKTADIIAIRDAVKALATVVIPKSHLVWGGHPAITPLIRDVLAKMETDVKSHVTLYQSEYFIDSFPKENSVFENKVITKSTSNEEDSLFHMRRRMFSENTFEAAIFIGGMEGVINEYQMFKTYFPNKSILPIASTGAASKIIFEEYEHGLNQRLLSDYAYMGLFKDLLFSN